MSQYIKLLKNGSSEKQNKLDSSNKPCAYFNSSDFEDLKSRIGNNLQSYHKLLKQIEKLSLLRNKTVHGVLPISKEMAEASYTIALDNFNNYLTYFLNQEDKNYVQESEYDILPEFRRIVAENLQKKWQGIRTWNQAEKKDENESSYPNEQRQ